ncbi:MAG TPA: serine--tRNA ligase [Candidatus Kapabacteria bacterium]|nr:serine--tRNA ligase [Candidatus Kapabacteria bacterium]
MLDINFVRNNLEIVKAKVLAKGTPFNETLFNEIDAKRRELITGIDQIKNNKNKLAKEIGTLKRQGKNTQDLEDQSKNLSTELAALEQGAAEAEEKFQDFILNIPNLPDDSVPIGKDASQNVVVREWGEKPQFDFEPKPHWDLGEINAFLDLPRAAKISGARFAIYMDTLAKLERVLIYFMLETHTVENGYTEILPPFLVNDESLIGTGNLPKFKDDLFKIEGHNLYLIPTAEVPLTNIHRDETLDEDILPRNYAAYTPCFRSEAGSYGKDVRGIIRQHQFNKVELLKFTTPESSREEHEKLTRHAESILQKLGLHYRVVLLCSGDMSFSSAKTYDIEVWMPARNGYMEISSCSNFLDFQARRAKIKYKTKDGKRNYLHTINGSGLAAGRTVAAIMENFQEKDGKISIPQVLKKYFPNRNYL